MVTLIGPPPLGEKERGEEFPLFFQTNVGARTENYSGVY